MTTYPHLSTSDAPAQEAVARAQAAYDAARVRDLATCAIWDALQTQTEQRRTMPEAIAFQATLTRAYAAMVSSDHEVQVTYRALRAAVLAAERAARR